MMEEEANPISGLVRDFCGDFPFGHSNYASLDTTSSPHSQCVRQLSKTRPPVNDL